MIFLKSVLSRYLEILGYKNRPKFIDKYLSVPSLLRLKKVGYFCGMDYASKEIYSFGEYISRYDHSLTVALLTYRYTKDKRATIAALFHDIATPCFSHVIDYMNKDYEKQESTEEYTEIILREDKILQAYLKEDHILIEDIIDFKKYSIVDNDRPRVCADRLDGVLLMGLFWTKTITIDDVFEIINDTQVFMNEEGKEEIGFSTKEIADLVLKTSETIDQYCHSDEDNYMMDLLSEITKLAIDSSYVTYDDLYRMDEERLIHILETCHHEKIKELLTIFKTVKKSDVCKTELNNIKIRDLNPLLNGKRLKSIKEE